MSKWADDNKDGLHAYAVETSIWGKTFTRIEYAANLAEAKSRFGWTRRLHTSVKVRRATRADAEADQ